MAIPSFLTGTDGKCYLHHAPSRARSGGWDAGPIAPVESNVESCRVGRELTEGDNIGAGQQLLPHTLDRAPDEPAAGAAGAFVVAAAFIIEKGQGFFSE